MQIPKSNRLQYKNKLYRKQTKNDENANRNMSWCMRISSSVSRLLQQRAGFTALTLRILQLQALILIAHYTTNALKMQS